MGHFGVIPRWPWPWEGPYGHSIWTVRKGRRQGGRLLCFAHNDANFYFLRCDGGRLCAGKLAGTWRTNIPYAHMRRVVTLDSINPLLNNKVSPTLSPKTFTGGANSKIARSAIKNSHLRVKVFWRGGVGGNLFFKKGSPPLFLPYSSSAASFFTLLDHLLRGAALRATRPALAEVITALVSLGR